MRITLLTLAVPVVLVALAACAGREPSPRPPETTSGTIPSGSGGPATSWTNGGGPISPGAPSTGDILEHADGGVIER